MPRKRTDLPEVYPIESLAHIDFVSSTIERVNKAIGGRGIPRRGIVEMYGVESGGKSTIALTFLPDLYIDMERTLDESWAVRFAPGMLMSRPETLEQAFGLIEHTMKAHPRVVVLDSLGGSLSEHELDSNQQASLSQTTSRWLRLLVNTGRLDDSCLLIVNQLRASFSPYGSPTTTPGGRVLRHLAGLRVSVRRAEVFEVAERKVGQSILLRVEKNKVGVEWAEGEVFLGYDGKVYESADALKDGARQRSATDGGAAPSESRPVVAGSPRRGHPRGT